MMSSSASLVYTLPTGGKSRMGMYSGEGGLARYNGQDTHIYSDAK